MGRNKKITRLIVAVALSIAFVACKTQPLGYVNLYVDNEIATNNATPQEAEAFSTADTVVAPVADTTSTTEVESPLAAGLSENLGLSPYDSTLYPTAQELPLSPMDSIKPIGERKLEQLKPYQVMPDSGIEDVSDQELVQANVLRYVMTINQQLREKSDSLAILRRQAGGVENSAVPSFDSRFSTQEETSRRNGQEVQVSHKTNRLLQSLNDSIASLRSLLHTMKSAGTVRADTVYIKTNDGIAATAQQQQPDPVVLQLFREQNNTIEQLRRELMELKLLQSQKKIRSTS